MNRLHPRLQRYGSAVLTVAIALGLTLVLELLLQSTAFALFYPAVRVAALYGGARPGLLAIALSVFLIGYSVLPPAEVFDLSDWSSFSRLLMFVLIALPIALVSAALHASRDQAEMSLHQIQLSSEKRFQQLVESNILGVSLGDFNGATFTVNLPILQLNQASESSVSGSSPVKDLDISFGNDAETSSSSEATPAQKQAEF